MAGYVVLAIIVIAFVDSADWNLFVNSFYALAEVWMKLLSE